MAKISSIVLPSGDSYDLKDASAIHEPANPSAGQVIGFDGSEWGAVTPAVAIESNSDDPLTITLKACPTTYSFGEKEVLTVTVTATSQYHFSFTCPAGTPTVLTINGATEVKGETLAAGESYEVDVWDGIALVVNANGIASSVSSVNGNSGAVVLDASDVGAVAISQGVSHAGEFCVVGSDGNITTVTMTAWQGGSY